MIRWGYIREIRPFNKSTPIYLNRYFWAITSCPQRTRGIEILMGPDYGRRCRPVLMTDILPAKWPEKKKKKKKKKKNVPTCLQNKAEKEAVRISVTCVPLRAMALFKFTCMCICKGLYSKTHTLFFARIMEYLFKICSFLIFFFFFTKNKKKIKIILKPNWIQSQVCVYAHLC